MAFIIVIGTDNSVQVVVDEVRKSHLQHNVVTSGCIISKDDNLFYHWDVYNAQGDKKEEGEKKSIALKDALANQIAQFKTLLPIGSTPNVFLIGSSHTKDDAARMKLVYDSLCEIGGTTLNTISIDVVLLGYDLNNCDDVTLRPSWKILRCFQGVETGRFPTDVLYINNMDYDGAATNVDAKLLGRFLSHWAKMVCSGGTNPKQTVQTNHYAIGLAERQYNFEDLTPFFKLAAEEQILDRALHDEPASPTKQMLDTKYYCSIDLDKPWIDGLCSIRDDWRGYCTYQYDYDKEAATQQYSLSVQKQKLVLYLNSWLKLYCEHQQRDIASLNAQIECDEQEISALELKLPEYLTTNPETGEKTESEEYVQIKNQISQKKRDVEKGKAEISVHKDNIERNSFADALIIKEDLSTGLLTNAQKDLYDSHLESEKMLFDYIHTDQAVDCINETIDRAINEDDSIPVCPVDIIDNVGRLEAIVFQEVEEPESQKPEPQVEVPLSDAAHSERSGCFGWFAKIFHKEKQSVPVQSEQIQRENKEEETISIVNTNEVHQQVVSSIKEFRNIKNVEVWWDKLSTLVKEKEERQKQCKLDMDGVILNQGTPHEKRDGGFAVPFHRKSISLIDVDKIRAYRDNDSYYLEQISKLKNRYFDSTLKENERQTMQQLIKHQVIDAVRGVCHTLHWDGSNPFCNELFTNDEIHNFIEDPENGMQKQSKPFVEYVKLDTQNITQHINYLFYFGHPLIEKQSNLFREKYNVSEGSLSPVFLPDLTNSLCEVQVLDVTAYVDNLADFKPRTEAVLHKSLINYSVHVEGVIGGAESSIEKAKAIYDWLCNNIAYDTTLTIHDADRCWQTKRGVCQAYCELFVRLAKAVGVTAEIISGKSKNPNGEISERDHAWLFVYTHGYDGIFIDPTWGAGYVKDGVFTPSPTDKWFDVNPDWLIFSHYAEDSEWNNKASATVSYEQFEKIPYYEPQNRSGEEILYKEIDNSL